jgi:hypothetical protein
MEKQDNTLRMTITAVRDWYNDQYYGVDYDVDVWDEDLDLVISVLDVQE